MYLGDNEEGERQSVRYYIRPSRLEDEDEELR
jgi:hypothetical protein